MRSVSFSSLIGCLGTLVLVVVGALGSPSADAQTVPSGCRPTGTYYDCVSCVPIHDCLPRG